MSDDESPVDTNVIDFRTSAQLRNSTSLDQDPDQVSRAMEQEKHFGIPAQTIMGDPEGYDEMFKRALGNRIIAKNTHLQDFINSHPSNAGLIHDDLGALDSLSNVHDSFLDRINPFGKFQEGFKEGFGMGPFGEWQDTMSPEWQRLSHKYPISSQLWTALGLSIEVPSRFAAGVVKGTESAAEPFIGEQGARDVAGMLEYKLQQPELGFHPEEVAKLPAETAQVGTKAADLAAKVEPFFKEGTPPPVGAAPEFDLYHKELAKANAKAIDDVLKAVQDTSLRERNPDALEQFIASHGDRSIGIQADAVRQLYGDKAPTPGDNKLGFIPDLGEQLARAEQYGGDVQVPLSTWLAKVDPAVAKDLNDFIRVGPEGMTVEESKEPITYPPSQPLQRQVLARDANGRPTRTAPLTPADQILNTIETYRDATATRPALHASPAEFAKFDLDKMGTSQGAASFGPGFYFAENPEVSGRGGAYDQEITARTGRPANIYEVNLKANLEKMIDHDKPIADQTPYVQGILRDLGVEKAKTVPAAFEELRDKGASPAALADEAASDKRWQGLPKKLSRAGIHGIHYLDEKSRNRNTVDLRRSRSYWEKNPDHPESAQRIEEINKIIAEEEAAPKTSNYVMFDPDRIDIKSRNGEPIAKPESEALKRTALERGRSGRATKTEPFDFKETLRVVRNAAGRIDRKQADEALAREAGFTHTALARSMTADMMRKYQDLIRKDLQSDARKQEAVAKAFAELKESKTWADGLASMRPQVQEEVLSRPEIQASRLLRTPEGKAVPADDLAGSLGYASGDEMKRAVAGLEQQRGKEDPTTFERRLVREELDRRMEAKYGNLPENILKEAKEHVLSPTVMDRIHEEVQAMGMAAGGQAPISKADLKAWVKQNFGGLQASQVSSDRFMAFAGKAGRAAEKALLDEKPNDAYKAKQLQEKALLLAREALDFEREKAGLERNFARYSKREGPAAVDSVFTHQIQGILQRFGARVDRTPKDLAEQIANDKSGTLQEFVANGLGDGQLLDVADFLLDPNFSKQLKDFTANEYLGLASSIKIMDKIGRDFKQQVMAFGNKLTADVVAEMRPEMEQFGKKDISLKDENWVSKWWDLPAPLLNTETILRHFDHGAPYGPFQRYIVHPISRAPNQKLAWIKEYAAKYEALGKIRDAEKVVDNPWLKDPRNGNAIKLTRDDLVGMISHWGNESNRDKFLKGWNIISKDGKWEDHIVRQEFQQWLVDNTRPEDWARAERQGKIFNEFFEKITKPLYHRLTGDTPEALDLEKFSNPHGTFDGWYHPLDYIAELNPARVSMRSAGLLSPDFKGMLPGNSYAHSRTGFYGPLEIKSSLVPVRLRQMIHDAAYRETAINLNKLFKDDGFRSMMTQSPWGQKGMKGLQDWLQFVVNGETLNETGLQSAISLGSYLRHNAVASYVGFNLGTPIKHFFTALAFSSRQVGFKDFAREFTKIAYDPREYLREEQFARDSSLLMQERRQTWDETFGAAQASLDGGGLNTFLKARAKWAHWGSLAVAYSDWLSARSTWTARYKQSFRETGGNHEMAVDQADAAVRFAHGTTAVTNLPAALRGSGEVAKFSLSLYTFFGTRFQRMAENAWDVGEAAKLVSEGELREAAKRVPKIAGDYATYTILPALIDSAVSGARLGKWGLLAAPLSSIPFIRDIYHHYTEGGDPETGLLSSIYGDLDRAIRRTGAKAYFSAQNAGQMVRDFMTAAGVFTGLGGRAAGAPPQYLIDLATGKQAPPKGPGDIYRGIRFGTSKERKEK